MRLWRGVQGAVHLSPDILQVGQGGDRIVVERKEMASKAEEILKAPYARVLIPADNGTYTAEILEFPGCVSEGETPEEALANVEDAAVLWIEDALEQGMSIPEASVNEGYAGKIAQGKLGCWGHLAAWLLGIGLICALFELGVPASDMARTVALLKAEFDRIIDKQSKSGL